MTRRRIGSGASAVSFGLAAGLAAAGGFATATALGLAGGGAGVLPSTGSAIVPLSDLATRKYESRQTTNQYSKERILGTTSYISASPVLSRRIPVSVRPWRCFVWFAFWTALRNAPPSIQPGTGAKRIPNGETSAWRHSWHRRTIFPEKVACSICSFAFAASRSGSRAATTG